MEILIIIFTILYAVLAWKRLDLATALLIAALSVYQIRFNVLGFPSTLLEIMILVLFCAWFFKSWQKKELPLLNSKLKNIKAYPFGREIILLLIIALISTAVSGFSNSALGILKAYFIEPIMFFIVFINVFKYEKNRLIIFYALALSAFIISIVAIYQRITGNLMPAEWINSGRVTGVFNYPNAVGLYLGSVIILLTGYLLSLRNFQFSIFKQFSIFNFPRSRQAKRGGQTLFIALSIITSLAAIYFAKSEGALIGAAAALFIFGLIYNRQSPRAVIGATIIVILFFSFNAQFRNFAVNKVLLHDLDGQIRRQMWMETWKMLKQDGMIFGVGLANYQHSVAPYHQEGIFVRNYNDPDFQRKVVFNEEYKQKAWQPLEIYLYPHNIFLNFWSELGLAGMLLFGWIIIKYFIMGIRNYELRIMQREIILGLLGAIIVIIVHGLVDVPYFKNDLAVLFWILVGMVGVYQIDVQHKLTCLAGKAGKSNTNNTNNTNKNE